MPVRWCLCVFAATLAVTVGCEGRGPQPTVSPSPLSSSQISPAPAGGSAQAFDSRVRGAAGGLSATHRVVMFDACDPDTFNAVLGAGSCVRSGGVTFDQFIAQLTKHGTIGSWHFAPPAPHMRVGQTLVALNSGGEVHTFTEVEDFGGGIVPQLNQLSGVPVVAPECTQLQPADFIAPGQQSVEVEDEAGVEKYQCCIHPWMRATLTVKE